MQGVSLKQVESYMFVVKLVHCAVCYPMFVCGGGAFGAICWCSITLETRRVVVYLICIYGKVQLIWFFNLREINNSKIIEFIMVYLLPEVLLLKYA
ncbi:hypothetical protein ES332_D07G040300v1 [Gossypium tomentosum]|uniref:Transmembrane protein n=1 Tax=Gossypium tomentosum TaxID=34277 RepID=A0A5D2K299_GOSTO|nr:hypothetical protein ES332_D07G040300v1 [Gossypium tomentosum]